MTKKLIQEILIPAEHGAAYIVKKDQTQRVIAIEGPQVGDMIMFNQHDYKEVFDDDMSYIYNSAMGTGNAKRLKYFFSRRPWCNIMFEATDDKVGVHFAILGGSCDRKRYELTGIKEYHRNCFDNLVEAIAPYGLKPEDVPQIFNLWMNVEPDPEKYRIMPPVVKKGDYIDLLAHMDCLVALSACPGGDVLPVNGEGGNKPLKVEIWE
ncbi:DUF1989 domain-containing protein [Chloroflexota bacterium]